jgi:hypothetical protein
MLQECRASIIKEAGRRKLQKRRKVRDDLAQTLKFTDKEMELQTWRLFETTAPGFGFSPNLSLKKKRLCCHFGEASPCPAPPKIYEHFYLFSGLYMIATLEVISGGIKSPNLHLEMVVVRPGDLKWSKSLSQREGSELELKFCFLNPVFSILPRGNISPVRNKPAEVVPQHKILCTQTHHLSPQQVGISRANFTYYLSVQD